MENNNNNNNNNADHREEYNNNNFDRSDYWYYLPTEDGEDDNSNDNSNDNNNDNSNYDDNDNYDELNENNSNINIIISSNVPIDDQPNLNIVNIVVNTLLGINVVESMNLMTHKMHKINIQDNEDNDDVVLHGDTCSVCLDEYTGNIMMLKECKHTFHEKCAKAWFRNQRTCPLCRTVCYHASVIKRDLNECNKNAN
jgi:hypothetical protein